MKNKAASDFFWHFDRAFGNSRKWGIQILYVLGILVGVTAIFTIVGYFIRESYVSQLCQIDDPECHYSILTQTIGLIFNVTNLPESGGMDTVPVWWQIVGILIGAVVFTGFTISFVSNFLTNRINAYRDGSVRYCFSDHILFLGGSKMIPPMIRELLKNPVNRKKHFVILTGDEPQKVRRHIDGVLTLE